MPALSIVPLFGALQGLLILLFIALRQRHPKNTPLALLLLVFSIRLATIPTWDADVLLAHPWIYPLTAPLPFLFGFLLWWYARELADETAAVPKRLYLHALPWAAETLAVTATVLFMSRPEYEIFVADVFAGHPPSWLPIRNALKVALNLVYVILTMRIAFGGRAKRLSTAKRIWLRALALLPAVVLVFFAYVAVVSAASARLAEGSGMPFLILAMTMTVLIYAISLLFLLAPEVSARREEQAGTKPEPLCSDAECERIAARLDECFADGDFRNPDLSLGDLASRLEIHPNRLSFAVNHARGMSFRSYLNRARLRDFLSRLESAAPENRSMLNMAFDAGFPSKSTFNRVFRESEGMSPSEYAEASRGIETTS